MRPRSPWSEVNSSTLAAGATLRVSLFARETFCLQGLARTDGVFSLSRRGERRHPSVLARTRQRYVAGPGVNG